MAMAITQWCSTAARRMMGAMEQRMSYSSSAAAMGGPILCGRGDKRTKKGKRFKDSYGNSRPKKEKKIERIKDKVEVPRTLCSCVVCELLCIGARFYPVRTQRVAAARFPCHQNEGHCN